MQSQRMTFGWTLRLDRGEEVLETLVAFAERERVRAAGVIGLGSLSEAELGFFLPRERRYERRVFRGDFELGSLTGNVSELDGRPFTHCHVVIAGPDFAAHTGHLFRGIVSVTCELQLVVDPGVLARVPRPDAGYSPLEPR